MENKTWFNEKKEAINANILSARKHLINSILNRVYMFEMLQDEQEDIEVREAILETIRYMIALVQKLQDMSYEELCMLNDSMEYMIDAAEFKQITEVTEKAVMTMIYQKHGELINEILYGSKEEQKVKTINQEKTR